MYKYIIELKQYEESLLNKWKYELKTLIATGMQLDYVRDELKRRCKNEE